MMSFSVIKKEDLNYKDKELALLKYAILKNGDRMFLQLKLKNISNRIINKFTLIYKINDTIEQYAVSCEAKPGDEFLDKELIEISSDNFEFIGFVKIEFFSNTSTDEVEANNDLSDNEDLLDNEELNDNEIEDEALYKINYISEEEENENCNEDVLYDAYDSEELDLDNNKKRNISSTLTVKNPLKANRRVLTIIEALVFACLTIIFMFLSFISIRLEESFYCPIGFKALGFTFIGIAFSLLKISTLTSIDPNTRKNEITSILMVDLGMVLVTFTIIGFVEMFYYYMSLYYVIFAFYSFITMIIIFSFRKFFKKHDFRLILGIIFPIVLLVLSGVQFLFYVSYGIDNILILEYRPIIIREVSDVAIPFILFSILGIIYYFITFKNDKKEMKTNILYSIFIIIIFIAEIVLSILWYLELHRII